MSEPMGEESVNEEESANPEEIACTKREWDLNQRLWKKRIYLLSAWLPIFFGLGTVLGAFLILMKGSPDALNIDLITRLTLFVPFGITLLFLALGGYHGFKYSRAGGKKWL